MSSQVSPAMMGQVTPLSRAWLMIMAAVSMDTGAKMPSYPADLMVAMMVEKSVSPFWNSRTVALPPRRSISFWK